MTRARTVVFVHAHPDDEALLTGGTMARLAAEGHRVVLVTATDGEKGLAAEHVGEGSSLGEVRAGELSAAARALGCADVVRLGFPDSGLVPDPQAQTFCTLPVEEVATSLADVLTSVGAEVVCGYDAAGGYGHPDHVQVHRMTRRAAALAGTPLLLEATIDRRALQAAVRLAAPVLPRESQYQAASFDGRFAEPASITHRVRVGRYSTAKRRALQAHASQATGGTEERLAAWLLRLPGPAFRAVLGREWFVEVGRSPGRRRSGLLLDRLDA